MFRLHIPVPLTYTNAKNVTCLKNSNKRPGGNKFQTSLRPGCYWTLVLITGPALTIKRLISARAAINFIHGLDLAAIGGVY